MPVKFTNGTFFQMLLGARDVMAGREILDDLFSDPTALEKPGLRVGEAPFQVWDNTVIGGLLAEIVRVLQVQCPIRSTCRHHGKVSDRPSLGA